MKRYIVCAALYLTLAASETMSVRSKGYKIPANIENLLLVLTSGTLILSTEELPELPGRMAVVLSYASKSHVTTKRLNSHDRAMIIKPQCANPSAEQIRLCTAGKVLRSLRAIIFNGAPIVIQGDVAKKLHCVTPGASIYLPDKTQVSHELIVGLPGPQGTHQHSTQKQNQPLQDNAVRDL